MVALAWPAGAHGQSISVSRPTVTEGDRAVAATIAITRTGRWLAPVRLHVYTVDGTARAPWDYTPYDGYVTLPALLSGTQSATVTVMVGGDLVPENGEYFDVRVDGLRSTFVPGGVWVNDTPDPRPFINRGFLTKDSPPQQLLSRAADGGLPNAPATDPVLSWDARTARYAAYTSAATNIAPATGGRRNVYLVTRGGRAGKYGTRWQYGTTTLASRGRRGRPANGESWSPALSRWTHVDHARGPACLAFVSRASNLVRGDRNGRADVFVRRIASGRLTRIASPRGHGASAVTIAGDCRSTAMVAGGALYVARPGRRLRRIARGPIRSPRLTYNGAAVSYAKRGAIYLQRIGRRPRRIAAGRRPATDGGRRGGVRAIAYQRAGAVYQTTTGHPERLISPGTAPSMTAGAAQTMFAHGPFVYMYAISNNYGKRPPQGFCPHGTVADIATSARGNYVAFACKRSAIYLSYIGPK